MKTIKLLLVAGVLGAVSLAGLGCSVSNRSNQESIAPLNTPAVMKVLTAQDKKLFLGYMDQVSIALGQVNDTGSIAMISGVVADILRHAPPGIPLDPTGPFQQKLMETRDKCELRTKNGVAGGWNNIYTWSDARSSSAECPISFIKTEGKLKPVQIPGQGIQTKEAKPEVSLSLEKMKDSLDSTDLLNLTYSTQTNEYSHTIYDPVYAGLSTTRANGSTSFGMTIKFVNGTQASVEMTKIKTSFVQSITSSKSMMNSVSELTLIAHLPTGDLVYKSKSVVDQDKLNVTTSLNGESIYEL